MDATRGPSFAADQDEGPQRGSGRPIPPLVSKIQVASTNAGARAQGGLTPDFLALSPVVSERYMKSFRDARAARRRPIARRAFADKTLAAQPYGLPPLRLDHLFRMTDRTGILQHAIFTVPNFEEGYCTDDNARAFLLTVLADDLNPGINPAEINP